MVTPQGFNALLKLVEEPPEHVKFIFATTEPEKVIGTIRSRTHHYPFRLVPPGADARVRAAALRPKRASRSRPACCRSSCAPAAARRETRCRCSTSSSPAPRARPIDYERAVALLGYTHAALLDEVVDAIGATRCRGRLRRRRPRRPDRPGPAPLRRRPARAPARPHRRRGHRADGAAAVLRGVPQDELDRMAAPGRRVRPGRARRASPTSSTPPSPR